MSSDKKIVRQQFGRYFLFDEIAEGGMAIVYRARLDSSNGAGKFVAIKKLKRTLQADNQYRQMFTSEIRAMSGLTHPNIVQLYDFGEEDGLPYIVMEYVDGKSLREIVSRFTKSEMPVPVELAVNIIEQAATGLAYVHSFKDKITDQPLNLVHRDISPQNIVISYDGTVKIIDFGIAKATTNIESTKSGLIKGKANYLSPEQIRGDHLDGRSDVFALGVVLWEILSGQKLFNGQNEYKTIQLIQMGVHPENKPSRYNPEVPPELDEIVMKAIAKSKDERFPDAQAFQRALRRVQLGRFPDFDMTELGAVMHRLFDTEIHSDRNKIAEINLEAERSRAFEQSQIPPPFRLPREEEPEIELEIDSLQRVTLTKSNLRPRRDLLEPKHGAPSHSTSVSKRIPVSRPSRLGRALRAMTVLAGLGAVALFGLQYGDFIEFNSAPRPAPIDPIEPFEVNTAPSPVAHQPSPHPSISLQIAKVHPTPAATVTPQAKATVAEEDESQESSSRSRTREKTSRPSRTTHAISKKTSAPSKQPEYRMKPEQIHASLIAATVSGEVSELNRLLKTHSIPVDQPVKGGRTLLMYASEIGQLEVAKFLIHKGANVNAMSADQQTPLTLAIRGGRVNVVRLLLSYNASRNFRGKGGETPLELARRLERSAIVRILNPASKARTTSPVVKSTPSAPQRMPAAQATSFPSAPPILNNRGAPAAAPAVAPAVAPAAAKPRAPSAPAKNKSDDGSEEIFLNWP